MNEEALPLQAGVRLNDRYIISRTLGVGGFGITYLAWDEEGVRQVVVKECMPAGHVCRDAQGDVRPVSSESAQVLAMCIENTEHEVDALQTLDVDGVVKFYDHFLERGTVYYAMEYIEGESLQEIADVRSELGEKYSAEELKGLMLNLLDILEQVHRKGIYHCDIKPGNVLITPEGKTVLIDFGAVRSRELQHAGSVQVTPGYSPPEFYPGFRREIGPWTDLYELGATFYRLLSGRIPEPGDQRSMRDRTQKLSHMAELKELYPQNLLSSIDKALSPIVRDRYPSAQAWMDFLGRSQSMFMMPALSVRQKSRAMARASLGVSSRHGGAAVPKNGISPRMLASQHAGHGVKRPTKTLGSARIPHAVKNAAEVQQEPARPVLTNKGLTLDSLRAMSRGDGEDSRSAALPPRAGAMPPRPGMRPSYASPPKDDTVWTVVKVGLIAVGVVMLCYLLFGNRQPEPQPAPQPAPKQRVYRNAGGMGVPAPNARPQPPAVQGGRGVFN